MHPKRPPLLKPPPYSASAGNEAKPELYQINKPAHYTEHGPIEVIEIIEGFKTELPNFGLPFHLANVIKYILRAGHKTENPALKDLLKAQYYLNRYIKLMQIAEESQKTNNEIMVGGCFPDPMDTKYRNWAIGDYIQPKENKKKEKEDV